MGRLYSTFRSNWNKNFSFGACTPVVAPMGVKFGVQEGTGGDRSPPARQISPPLMQRVALRGEKPQNAAGNKNYIKLR